MEYKLIPNTTHSVSISGDILNGKGRRLRPYKGNAGYVTIKLRVNGKSVTRLAHRLVWQAWRGEIPEGIWINHKDGNKQNNHVDNLELTTPSENHLHASRVLKRRYARGIECATATISPEGWEAIEALSAQGWSQHKLAKAFGVAQSGISQHFKKRAT